MLKAFCSSESIGPQWLIYFAIPSHQDNAPVHKSLVASNAMFNAGFEWIVHSPYLPSQLQSDFYLLISRNTFRGSSLKIVTKLWKQSTFLIIKTMNYWNGLTMLKHFLFKARNTNTVQPYIMSRTRTTRNIKTILCWPYDGCCMWKMYTGRPRRCIECAKESHNLLFYDTSDVAETRKDDKIS